MRVHIKENSWAAAIAAKSIKADSVALVIGKTIHLWKVSKQDFLKNPQWLQHEMVHIRQFERYGFFRFVVMYLIESLKHGYWQNKFEKEARAEENDIEITKGISFFNP